MRVPGLQVSLARWQTALPPGEFLSSAEPGSLSPVHSYASRTLLTCLTHRRTEIAPRGYLRAKSVIPRNTCLRPRPRQTPPPPGSQRAPSPSVRSWLRSHKRGCSDAESPLCLTCSITWKAKSQRRCPIQTKAPPTFCSNQRTLRPTRHGQSHKVRVTARRLAWVIAVSFREPGAPPF